MASAFKLRQSNPPAPVPLDHSGMAQEATATKPLESVNAVRSRRSDQLVLSWIHGKFQAAVYRRQQMVASWQSDRSVRSLEEFRVSLEEGVRQLAFHGVSAELVIEREDFSHQMESLPPASRRVQREYIRNRALRNAGDTGMTYAFQRTFSPKSEQNVILHLLPEPVFKEIVGIFEGLHIQLNKLFPLFALMPLQLQRLRLERAEIVLMVTENFGATSMVAGRRDGQILFGRSIFTDWRQDAARVATELNRSILFARQRFGITINTVFLSVESTDTAREALKAHLDQSFLIQALDCPSMEWLGHLHRLPIKDPANLLADTLQQKTHRKLVRFAFTGAIWLLFALSMLSALRSEWNYQFQELYISDLQSNRAQLESTLTTLAEREAAVRQSDLVVAEVLAKKAPPVAAKFALWLAPHLSDNLRLTRLQVSRQASDSTWTFRIEGESNTDVDATLAALDSLETNLSSGVFRAKITANNQVAIGSFVSRRSVKSEREFFIEGTFFAQ